MSFILDALRKSEHERQRQAGPGIADVPIARAPSRLPLALLAVAVLLAVNLAALLYFMSRDDAPGLPAEVPAAPMAVAPATSQVRPAAVAPALPPPPEVTPQRREVRPLTAEAAMAREAPAAPDPSLLPPSPSLVPASPRVGRSQPPDSPGAGNDIPRLDTLPAQATAGLPALNLDLHIYATDPAQRAAFINGRRYREGDSLPEGVMVASITRDGAVLSYRGQRFLLPRQ